jgi:hypothetical protein
VNQGVADEVLAGADVGVGRDQHGEAERGGHVIFHAPEAATVYAGRGPVLPAGSAAGNSRVLKAPPTAVVDDKSA